VNEDPISVPIMDKDKPSATVQEQLSLVISMLKEQGELLSDTRRMLADSQAKVLALEAKVGALEHKVTSLECDLTSLKEVSNNREQASKLCTIRVHGFPVSDEELAATDGGKTLANKVYERILKPILAAARAKGDIPSVPHCANAIEDCYRAGRPSKSGKPAPLIVKLSSKNLRLAVLRNKRANTPAPLDSERSEFIKRFSIVEDLTTPTYKLLRQLQDNDNVVKVWTVEGRIRFTLAEHPNTIVKVKSVFQPIEKILNTKQ
jgi:hypothetical protein